MNRLTKWNGTKWVLPQGRTQEGKSNWRLIADRLAEYENTELTPNEIMEITGKEQNMESGFYIQAQSKINGRGVWYYLIASPIGNFHIIEYEQRDMSLKRFVYDDEDALEKASRKYRSVLRKLTSES